VSFRKAAVQRGDVDRCAFVLFMQE
jgi:hypothetical protein